MPEKGRLLNWQPGFSLSRKPTKKSVTRRRKKQGADVVQQYEFICEYPTEQNHEPRPAFENSNEFNTATSEAPDLATVLVTDGTASPDCRACPYDDGPSLSGDIPSEASAGNSLLGAIKHADIGGNEVRTIDCSEGSTHHTEIPAKSKRATATPGVDIVTQSQDHQIWIPSSILYSSLAHRFESILDQYNQEFCKIPLTFDLQINPFQYRKGACAEPLFLVHAAMALAGHHVESQSTEHHRGTALQLLREGLDTSGSLALVYHMLDAIVILFSLDETQSAWGNWSTHLMGAYAILEACGSIEVWSKSPRAVVQVGLLIWWDAITSLVAREDCVFPYSYFEAVTSSNTSDHEWDYFRLCGCPLELVRVVMHLARLSAEKRKATSMQYVKFDGTVISDIEKSLMSWQHISPPTADQDESSMHQDMDSMHCAEAWRNGLLLYLYRVFQWEPGRRVPMRVARLARVTADHVFACRDDSSLVAKQALLPLFFAGCELRDESTRGKILRLCSVWDGVTRYHMFDSTVPLLKEVWADQEQRGFDDVWWGQVVDRLHAGKESRSHPLRMRLCFG
ncbi:hypothetical protein PG985_012711 [Apiospora marii]|uniref:uncharacterized protein n=1 Tax=Apiospora marii TaxID=335849 RepID=UPI0031308A14